MDFQDGARGKNVSRTGGGVCSREGKITRRLKDGVWRPAQRVNLMKADRWDGVVMVNMVTWALHQGMTFGSMLSGCMLLASRIERGVEDVVE